MRKAIERVGQDPSYTVFAGFNALTKAEQTLLHKVQNLQLGEVIYDADPYFLDDPTIHAGLFIRANLKANLGSVLMPKESISSRPIEIVLCEAAHYQEQAQVVAGMLSEVPPNELKNTVVVLADEAMLIPILSKLPESVGFPNITMGLGLGDTVFSNWLCLLFENLSLRRFQKGIYSVNASKMTRLLLHPFSVSQELHFEGDHLQVHFIDLTSLQEELLAHDAAWTRQLFGLLKSQPHELLYHLSGLFEALKNDFQNRENPNVQDIQSHKSLVLLCRAAAHMQKLSGATQLGPSNVQSILSKILSGSKVDLLGDAKNNFQIMGILETRALSFERVIICSFNEDVFPKRANMESFIPFEVRMHHHMAGRREKEGVYAYYFYRLLAYAKQLQLTWNGDKDEFNGGGRSRYVYQLIYELSRVNPNIDIVNKHLQRPQSIDANLSKCVTRDDAVTDAIRRHIEKGISASSINLFLQDRLEWYYRYVLRLREPKGTTLDHAEIGTLAHSVLENLYKPFVGKSLTIHHFELMAQALESEIRAAFAEIANRPNPDYGMDRIHFESMKGSVTAFLNSEKKFVQKGNEIVFLEAEIKLEKTLQILSDKGEIKANFVGFVDRLDRRNGVLEVIDYKTGTVGSSDLNLNSLDHIDVAKKPKVLQLLLYQWLAEAQFPQEKVNSRIISLPKPLANRLFLDKSKFENGMVDFENFLTSILQDMLISREPLCKNEKYSYAKFA